MEILQKKDKPKILVILGPTSSGKSDLAVLLAKKNNGEVVSADSRQIYKGLDIGSGKITKKEMRGVPHHLLDVESPRNISQYGGQFSVEKFRLLAEKAIDDILSRGKLPIICGGTGFYIQAIVDGIVLPDVPANLELRTKLRKIAEKNPESLFKMLQKLDSKRAENIDPKNIVRVIRAIEIAKTLGKVPAIKINPKYEATQIGILLDDEILKNRINKRITKRFKIGMIEEISNLHKKGISWKALESLGLEYRYISQFLQKKIDRKQMIELLQNETWHYAKRQMTWFKKDTRIKWMKSEEIKTI